MLLINGPCRAARAVVAWLVLLLLVQALSPAWAAESSSSTIVTKICPAPPICFKSKEERQTWAKQNNCKFLEDVCEKTPASEDDKGAKAEDQGFWSGLWNDVSGAVKYGYEFGKGLFSGMKEQITDVIDLISNPGEVAAGLVHLGKAFFNDPKGTLATLGQLLGQEAVDTITKATQCGAYDLGKVIGSYVSPAVALKLAVKLGKFTGKLADAVKATKLDLGCASFAAGTVVHTAGGLAAIDALSRNDTVASRHEVRWTDAQQRITDTFTRVAPSHRRLTTELESFSLTGEHPLWVQGRGWTEAKDVAQGDVLASLQGDVLVRGNVEVTQPLRVHNFSVANTPNYFVGESGLWAHNAKCDLTLTKDIMDSNPKLLGSHQKGFYGEVKVYNDFINANYKPIVSVDPKAVGAFEKWRGTTGVDGIFKDKNGNYVIVESKTTGAEKPKDPCGSQDKLCKLTGGETQMSNKWIFDRVNSMPEPDRSAILSQMNNGTLTRVYAKTEGDGTTKYFKIDSDPPGSTSRNDTTAKVGGVWKP
jgi:hypothetical protein